MSVGELMEGIALGRNHAFSFASVRNLPRENDFYPGAKSVLQTAALSIPSRRAEIRRSLLEKIEVYSTMLRARRPPKMPILAPLVLVLLFAAGIFFTGCTSLVRGFNRVRAEMTKPATDEETHNYGAFYTTPRSLRSDGPTK
jgi:hypothetical protein